MDKKPLWFKQAEFNKGNRFNWKKLLGETLTARITRLRNHGLNEKEIYGDILRQFPYLTAEAKKRLKISISARCAEQSAHLERIGSRVRKLRAM